MLKDGSNPFASPSTDEIKDEDLVLYDYDEVCYKGFVLGLYWGFVITVTCVLLTASLGLLLWSN